MKKNIDTDNFTLVLSGGGALGIAHLGVYHDLEKLNLSPKEIVGTSMGGIIGACIAIGMSEKEIYEQIKNFSNVFNWLKFSFSGNAFVENDKIEAIFKGIFQERKMKDTLIPLKLIATNLHNGHKKVFTAEDDVMIKDAILSTMAIPGVFEEHIIDNETYGDGFLCENLGVNEASLFDDVLAVDVMGENSFEKQCPTTFSKQPICWKCLKSPCVCSSTIRHKHTLNMPAKIYCFWNLKPKCLKLSSSINMKKYVLWVWVYYET